ncbi:MAG: MarR family transcriptional regulator [Streptosporangiaceae bacterium]
MAHYPGQPVAALARTLGLTHSGAVRLADRLEAADLARRTSSGHGRTPQPGRDAPWPAPAPGPAPA